MELGGGLFAQFFRHHRRVFLSRSNDPWNVGAFLGIDKCVM
jgi:hypothetical protein